MRVISKVLFQVPPNIPDLKADVDSVVKNISDEIVKSVEAWLKKTCESLSLKMDECELHVMMNEYLDTYVLKHKDKMVGVPFTVNWSCVTAVKKAHNEVSVQESNLRTEQSTERTGTARNKKK